MLVKGCLWSRLYITIGDWTPHRCFTGVIYIELPRTFCSLDRLQTSSALIFCWSVAGLTKAICRLRWLLASLTQRAYDVRLDWRAL